ncbi:MAG: alpha/beta fold hydrolase [Anaerolineae bacterium]
MKQQINGIQMNYEDTGNGPALLLVHGFPLDHTLWTHQVEALKDNYRLITPDLRGQGQSQAPRGPYRMDQMADDLRALVQALDMTQVVLVGLSMGGYVALAFWRIYPHLVRALVLSNTRAAADTPDGRLNRQVMAQRLQDGERAAIVEELLPKLVSLATLENKPEVVDHVRRMMYSAQAAGLVGTLQGMAERPDSTPTLKTIFVPTLLVVGQDDALTPPAQAKAMRATILARRRQRGANRTEIPEVTLALVPDAGHLPPLENPVAFNRALREFLAGLPG